MRVWVHGVIWQVFFPAVLLLALALPAGAQDLAAREQQLRQRVDEVYRLFVAADWRGVEQYLTEDSKAIWAARPKQRYGPYSIESVRVADDGLHADVTVRTIMSLPMAPTTSLEVPQPTQWVYSNGVWLLSFTSHKVPLDLFQTSARKFTPYVKKSPIRFEQDPVELPPIQRGERTVVQVPFQNVSGEVARIRGLRANCSCLTVKADKTTLQPDETGILTVTYRAPNRLLRNLSIGATLHPGSYLLDLRVHPDNAGNTE